MLTLAPVNRGIVSPIELIIPALLLVILLMVPLIVRVLPMFAAIAMHAYDQTWGHAWRLTRGHSWKLSGIYVLGSVPIFACMIAAVVGISFLLPDQLTWMSSITSNMITALFNIGTTTVGASLTAEVYRQLTGFLPTDQLSEVFA